MATLYTLTSYTGATVKTKDTTVVFGSKVPQRLVWVIAVSSFVGVIASLPLVLLNPLLGLIVGLSVGAGLTVFFEGNQKTGMRSKYWRAQLDQRLAKENILMIYGAPVDRTTAGTVCVIKRAIPVSSQKTSNPL